MTTRHSPLLQNFGCGVLLFDRRGRLTFANTTARVALKLGDRELLGEGAKIHPWTFRSARGEPVAAEEHPFFRILHGEKLQGDEFRLLLEDGTLLEISLNGSPRRSAAGDIEGGVVDFTDVTEKNRARDLLRQAKERLEESEARLRALVGSIDEIVFEFDGDGTYLNIWTANEHLLLRPREELLGNRVDEVFDEETGRRFRDIVRQVRETGEPMSLEYPLDVLGGRRWFLARVAPVPAVAGKPPTVSFLARDITERHRMEEELRSSERRFHQILESVQLAAMILDRSGRIAFCNDFLLKRTGWRWEAIEGKDWFDFTQPAGGKEAAKKRWLKAIDAGTLSGYHEEELAAADGSRLLIGWNTIVIRNREGKGVSCASIGEDITERRRAEDVLRRSDQMKTEFISITAHELRTPLTSILGYGELLLTPDQFGVFTPEQQHDFLQEIYDKAVVLAGIVNELLDLSRIESGQPIPLRLEPCPLDALLQKKIRDYQLHFPRHRFSLVLVEGCPAELRIDRQKIEQVMENLLSNAVKYSPPGSRVQVTGRRREGDYEVEVADEGIGMTGEQLERIFDKFYRADFSDTAAGGLGLGMSIVRGIIEAHGGRIEVSSSPGAGTRVTFRLPLGGVPASPGAGTRPVPF